MVRSNFKVLLSSLFVLSSVAFAQDALREAVDSGNIAAAKKMVKSGEIEEIYCGKLPADDAVSVYEKIFKQMPDESFAACPGQFSYGYGAKVCANAKAMNGCGEVVGYLLTDASTGNPAAFEALEKVVAAALKTKAFAKPVKVPVDTMAWVACPKKGKGKKAVFDAACIEECKANADSLNDSLHREMCDTKPEHFVETTLNISQPSPLYERIRTGLLDGFWKAPMSVAADFSRLLQSNAKSLSVADSLVPNLAYVSNWADAHKANGEALPGGELFRFCTAWQPAVDSMLALKEIGTRCPVFETFVDPRDQKQYKVKDIGGVKWFVQNLDYAVEEGSMCYDREDENCKTYGRLYTQPVAQSVCPEGSRIAGDEDWKALEELAGGSSVAAEKLRSNGSDEFAFTAVFGGYANKNGISTIAGEGAYFWTEKVAEDGRGVARSMFSTDKDVSSITVDSGFYMAVRCIVNSDDAK